MTLSQKEQRRETIHRAIRRVTTYTAALNRRADQLSWVRLGTFASGVFIVLGAYYLSGPRAMLIALVATVVLFALSVGAHRLVEQRLERHMAWLTWYRTELARMALDWTQIPAPRYDARAVMSVQHPFAFDMDIVGERSLHRLVDTTTARESSRLLCNWLTALEPDLATLPMRQAVVRDLTPRHRLRSRLQVAASLNRTTPRWTAEQLRAALEPSASDTTLWAWAIGLTPLAWLTITLMILNGLGFITEWWYLTLIIYGALLFVGQRYVGDMFQNAMALEAELSPMASVFRILENTSFRATPALAELCAPFQMGGEKPSRLLERTVRIVNLTGLRSNPIMWLVLNLAIPYDFLCALLFNRVKRDLERQLPTWMERWFTLESLAALANVAYLNPQYQMPVIEAETAIGNPAAALQADSLGHPLLPDEAKVSNNFTIPALGTVALITGSNMAGKSSFLKTIGVNLALTFAGGPVDAAHLTTIPFRLFASMTVNDSVTDGISFFYAEVKRLKALLNALSAPDNVPLLFLIDEIFRGTNNRERLTGARAYTRTLVGKHGTGLISTHDLELTHLAEELPAITNYHFREEVQENRMVFDYRLRPGPCPTTNALKIMELEGLPV